MKATGIVRRIDDLGRIVIPKEIRRNMNIREGDPFELYTSQDGEIILKKYMPYDEHDWMQAKAIVAAIIKSPFALYDRDGDRQATTSSNFPISMNIDELPSHCHEISDQWDCYGYILTEDPHPQAKMVVDVLKAFLRKE